MTQEEVAAATRSYGLEPDRHMAARLFEDRAMLFYCLHLVTTELERIGGCLGEMPDGVLIRSALTDCE